MKKNIVIGGIICLILAVFRLCSLIYAAVVFENFYPEYILDIVLILTVLIIPGIIKSRVQRKTQRKFHR